MTDRADPKFVNTLQINGFVNGVVNLGFSTAKWFLARGEDDEVIVASDEPITVDLRMDLSTAIATRDALTRIIDNNTKPSGGVN